MKKHKEIEITECVATFEHSVLKYNELLLQGSDQANRNYYAYLRALKQLNKMGDDGLSALTKLFNHENRGLRVMAASYLIHRYTDKAKKVLTEAAEAERPIGGLAI